MRARAAVVACALALAAPPARAQAPDRELAAAIQLLESGDLAGAVDALTAAVRALSGQPARAKDLARAHLHLGIAYALVDPPQDRAAQASFREALKADPAVAMPADRYPARVVRLFNAAREDAGAAPARAPQPSPAAAPRPGGPGTRVGLFNIQEVTSAALNETEQQKLREALFAAARAAGVDLVVHSHVVMATGPVADVSRAAAARYRGQPVPAVAPGATVRACVVDLPGVTTSSRTGQGYAAQVRELEKRIQDDGAAKQARLATLDAELAQARKDLELQRAVLSEQAAARKARDIEDKQRQRDAFVGSGQRELEEARTRAQARAQAINVEFQNAVRPYIEGAARDRRCDLVFDSQYAMPVSDPGADLTADVTASLDAGRALGVSPRTAAGAPASLLAIVDVTQLKESSRARAWRAEAERRTEKAATADAEPARQARIDAEVLAQVRPYVEAAARQRNVAIIVGADAALAADVRADLTPEVLARLDGTAALAPPPPPSMQPVRVGGEIKEPRKLKDVPPVYPDIARQARVQGVVILECEIGPDGRVTEVKVLRGIPLLDAAAMEAVRQWVYTPTLLNGVPVPVIMTVTVNFRLS
jgi:TonB family protein